MQRNAACFSCDCFLDNMTFEHLHQVHKEDACLIWSALLWMNIEPHRGKKLDEWSHCIPHGSRLVTTRYSTDINRHVWMVKGNSSIVGRCYNVRWTLTPKRWSGENSQCLFTGRLVKKRDFWVQMCVLKEWHGFLRWEQTKSSTTANDRKLPCLPEKQPNLSSIWAGFTHNIKDF